MRRAQFLLQKIPRTVPVRLAAQFKIFGISGEDYSLGPSS
jgi:hypothetical protein